MPAAHLAGKTDFEYLAWNKPGGGYILNTVNPHAGNNPAALAAAATEQPTQLTSPEEFPSNVPDLRAAEDRITSSCAASKKRIDDCASDGECQNASMAHMYCMATLLCKKEAHVFENALNHSGGDRDVDAAFQAVQVCMGRFENHARSILDEARK